MAKSPGRCIFCGESGLTKQHIWPAWLKKYNLPDDTHHSQIIGEASFRAPKEIKTSVEHRQGHSGSRKLHKVCRACNGGWIRRLEESVKTLVLSLMGGEAIVLDAHAQRKLSAWLTLLTIMAELTHPPTIAVPPEHRHWLRDKLEPADGWHVFIARYSGTGQRQYIARHYGMQLAEPPDLKVETHVCDTQTSTFVIGQLCGHTFSSTIIPQAGFDGYHGKAIIQIWPVGPDIVWEQATRMGDNGVVNLSMAFFRAIPPAR